jgi:uncharacterized membrane protein
MDLFTKKRPIAAETNASINNTNVDSREMKKAKKEKKEKTKDEKEKKEDKKSQRKDEKKGEKKEKKEKKDKKDIKTENVADDEPIALSERDKEFIRTKDTRVPEQLLPEDATAQSDFARKYIANLNPDESECHLFVLFVFSVSLITN